MNDSPTIDVAKIIDEAKLSTFHICVAASLFIIMVLDGFDTAVVAFVAPAIGKSLNIPAANFTFIFSAGLLGGAVGAFAFGRLADRVGRKIVLVGCTIEFALLTIACAFAKSYEWLLVLRMLAGLGLGGAMPNLFALASEYSPVKYRITIVTLTLWGYPLGITIGGFLVALLITDYGWQSAFLLGGIAPLLLLPVLIMTIPESVRFLTLAGKSSDLVARILNKISHTQRYSSGDSFVLRESGTTSAKTSALFHRSLRSGTILLSFTLFNSFVIVFLLTNWIPLVLAKAGLPPDKAAMGSAVFSFSGLLGSLLVTWTVRRVRPLPVVGFGYIAGTVALIAIGLFHAGTTAAVASLFLSGFFIVGVHLSIVGYIAAFYPTQIRATGIGFTQAVSRVGSFVGPLLGGLLVSYNLEPGRLFQFIAIPSFLAGIAVLILELAQRTRSVVSEQDVHPVGPQASL